MNTLLKLSITTASLVLFACAQKPVNEFDAFSAKNLNSLVQSGELQPKVDNLLVLVDASSSMTETYKNSPLSSTTKVTKLGAEKEILSRLNQTIPNIPLNSGIRSFGSLNCLDWSYTKLNKSMGQHSTASFDEGLASITCASGVSPLHQAISSANEDLAGTSGNVAILIMSDGYQLDVSPAAAAQALKDAYGDRLCIYSVWIGEEIEDSGHETLQELSDISGCGFVTDYPTITSSSAMAGYVNKLLFERVPVTGPDSDGDGVTDAQDHCPDTPSGAEVDLHGCWAYHGVFFDFDKYEIKPESEPVFNNAVKVFAMNPGLTVEIQGHTDNIGDPAYNMTLSEKRAQAVKDHLVELGVSADRITTKGFGMTDPVADNDTAEGRSDNRRVFYKRTDR